VDLGNKEQREPKALDYSTQDPGTIWTTGWRSWLLGLVVELIVRVILPLAVVFGVIWILRYVYGSR
jgi:hypothetical protein